MTKSSNKITYTYAYGRRKSAIASVKLFTGKGETTVNGSPLLKYFPGISSLVKCDKPFKITDTVGKYYFQAKIVGGGKVSQVDEVPDHGFTSESAFRRHGR